MAITRETLRLAAQLRADIGQITDQTVRDLVAAWARAWDEVSLDLELALTDLAHTADGKPITRAMVIRAERLTRSLLVIQNRLEKLTADAGVRITADLDDIVRRADAAQVHIVTTQLPPGSREFIDAWSTVDGRQLQAIVKRTTGQIHSRLRPLSHEATTAMKRELVRGVAAGSNPRTVARQLLQRVEGRFNGGLARATAIARTEMLDAHRQASLESRKLNADVLKGWQWHCELSERTCPACIAMDGQLFPVDAPGPDDHVNGRCVAVPVTKSWADLGITDMVEPKSVLVPASDRFAELPEATQRSILGPARYDAWKAGDYPPEAWAVNRSNDGWRDSVQVSRAPRQTGGSGGRRGSSTALAS